MPLFCIQECLVFWENTWFLHQSYPLLHVLEGSRATFEVNFLRAQHKSLLSLTWVWWSQTWPSHPSQRLFMRGEPSNRRAPAWSSASCKGQSRAALVTGSDSPITFSPLHHSLFACTPPRVPGKPLHTNITPRECKPEMRGALQGELRAWLQRPSVAITQRARKEQAAVYVPFFHFHPPLPL